MRRVLSARLPECHVIVDIKNPGLQSGGPDFFLNRCLMRQDAMMSFSHLLSHCASRVNLHPVSKSETSPLDWRLSSCIHSNEQHDRHKYERCTDCQDVEWTCKFHCCLLALTFRDYDRFVSFEKQIMCCVAVYLWKFNPVRWVTVWNNIVNLRDNEIFQS